LRNSKRTQTYYCRHSTKTKSLFWKFSQILVRYSSRLWYRRRRKE